MNVHISVFRSSVRFPRLIFLKRFLGFKYSKAKMYFKRRRSFRTFIGKTCVTSRRHPYLSGRQYFQGHPHKPGRPDK